MLIKAVVVVKVKMKVKVAKVEERMAKKVKNLKQKIVQGLKAVRE